MAIDETARIQQLRNVDKDKLPPDGGMQYNRLIFSGSPYLLQHADNPVDWYPWSDEAFLRARSENKPIFLSIGYSTCHWCHVMAHESFENRQIAAVINRLFIPIKVDREEHPDVDAQYMLAAQLMNQPGGWPLNIILTPDRKPFFAATYLPPTARGGMPGITDILEKIASAWIKQRDKIEKHGSLVIESLQAATVTHADVMQDDNLLEKAYLSIKKNYDSLWGGFGSAPKFPMPLYLSLLLGYAQQYRSPEALEMATRTLRFMRQGGVYDQLGFGFHRYSVDREWLVPHFEKMLYDQSLLALAYLQAFKTTGEDLFLNVAEEIFIYAEREMASPEGGYYSALDADSEGREGLYYLWTKEEVAEVIGQSSADIFLRLFSMDEKAFLESGYILSMPLSLEKFAEKEDLTVRELERLISYWRRVLLAVRTRRIHPLRDEKVLTSWNGLMIAALANAYGATGNAEYKTRADRSISFVIEKMSLHETYLDRVNYPDGTTIPGLLEDYAFFCWGLIDMYENTLSVGYLAAAIRYTKAMLELFYDRENRAFFTASADAEIVMIRMQGGMDGVVPAGNSIAILNLLRLGYIAQERDLLETGKAALAACRGNVSLGPVNYAAFLDALNFVNGPRVELTLAGDPQSNEMRKVLAILGKCFIPGMIIRHAVDKSEYPYDEGKAAVYICASGSCRPVITDVQKLEAALIDFMPFRDRTAY